MKKSGCILVCSLLFSLFSTSCENNETEIPFSVSTPTEVPADGGNTTLTIETTGEWNIVPEAGVTWYEITPLSGVGDASVSIIVASNDTMEARKSQITVTGTRTEVIELTQSGSNPILEATGPDPIDAVGGDMSFNITSNVPWTVTNSDATWFALDIDSGDGDAVITITAEPNSGELRRADITITADNATVSKTVTVTQNAVTLEHYLGTYKFTARTLKFEDGDPIWDTDEWTDVLKEVGGGAYIQFSNMADLRNDSFHPFANSYADFKWTGTGLDYFATRYFYPELFGFIQGGFIGCIRYDSGPKDGTRLTIEDWEATLDLATGELHFPQEFTDPDDGTAWPASYTIAGWDNTGQPAGTVSGYLYDLTATKID